jgi:serine/threonine protein kinase
MDFSLHEVRQILAKIDLLLQGEPNLKEALDALETLREQEKLIRVTAHDMIKDNNDACDNLLQQIEKQKRNIKDYINRLMKNGCEHLSNSQQTKTSSNVTKQNNHTSNDNCTKSNQSQCSSNVSEKDKVQPSTEGASAKCASSGPSSPLPQRNRSESHEYQPLPFKEKEISYQSALSLNSNKTAILRPPEIDENEIIYDEKDFIGEGSYGRVYRGTCRGKKVAIKVPKQKLTSRQIEQFRHEVAVMSKIFHPNIVLFMGACTKGMIKIVTELCVTDVEKLLRSDQPLTLYERMKMAKGASLGMNWLHGICKIIHRDLKPANLLVAEDRTVKVTDFGFGKYFAPGKTLKGTAKGTPLWMAPEVMLRKETNEKRDVYSFGIILWEFLTRRQPFSEFKDWKQFKHAVCVLNARPKIPDDCLPSLRYLMERCWDADYKKRPGFSEIIFRLNEVLVDAVIEDELGRRFWKEHFLLDKPDLEESVPWTNFVKLLTNTMDLREECQQRLTLLKPFLCDQDTKRLTPQSDPFVTLFSFDRTIKWFGFFFLKQEYQRVLEDIERLTAERWFHGYITAEEANKRLETTLTTGTYLVRLSTTSPGKPYTLSILTSPTHIDHRRIIHTHPNDTYTIRIEPNSYSFSSLIELVNKCKELLNLKEPCPRDSSAVSNYL